MVYTPRFFFQSAVCFIILTYLVPVLFTSYIQSVLKLKKNNSGAKRLNHSLPNLKQLPAKENFNPHHRFSSAYNLSFCLAEFTVKWHPQHILFACEFWDSHFGLPEDQVFRDVTLVHCEIISRCFGRFTKSRITHQTSRRQMLAEYISSCLYLLTLRFPSELYTVSICLPSAVF